MEFKVGDVVKRIRDEHGGMCPGDIDQVIGTNSNGSIKLLCYDNTCISIWHDPANFVLYYGPFQLSLNFYKGEE